jgi:hypothetical protein
MKKQGSLYVVVVFAALIGYFTYQWWFNPTRMVKQRLGEIAEALSMPAGDQPVARIARLAQLRRYLADDIHVQVGTATELTSRDLVLGAAGAWTPPATGADVAFADVQIVLQTPTTAHAFVSVEITTRSPQGQPELDSRDASLNLALRDGEWVVTKAEAKELPAVKR